MRGGRSHNKNKIYLNAKAKANVPLYTYIYLFILQELAPELQRRINSSISHAFVCVCAMQYSGEEKAVVYENRNEINMRQS